MTCSMSRRAFFATQALAAGTLLAGCSGNSERSEPDGPRSLSQIRDSHVVRVGVFSDASPLATIGHEGTYLGIDTRYGTYLASRLGTDVEFVAVDPRTRYDALIEGRIDVCASGMSPSDDRSLEVELSVPLYALNLAVVCPTEQAVTDPTQLAEGELIVCEGSYAKQYAEETWPDVTLRPYSTLSECYAALEGGYAPALLADDVCAAAWQRGRFDFVLGMCDIATPRAIAPACAGDPDLAAALDSVVEKFVTRNYLRKAYDDIVDLLPDDSFESMLNVERDFGKQ